MRTITSAQQGVINSGTQADYVRVSIKDGGGTFRDVSVYPGFDALKSVKWSEKIDDPHMTVDVTLFREAYKLSLSPYMAASAVNKGFSPGGAFSPLIALNREIKVEAAVVAMDHAPSSGDWFEVFHGRIDSFDAAKGKDVTIAARGLGGRLAQQYIKEEKVYALADDGGSVSLFVWQPGKVFQVGQYVLPASRGAADPGSNAFFFAVVAGTTGSTEPAWSPATTIDGSVHWVQVSALTLTGFPVEGIMQEILDDNLLSGDTPVTLQTPVSPGWQIKQFIQSRGFTLDAVRALASQIGWDLRFKWSNGLGAFALTFYQPTRSAPTVLFTFTADDYGEPTQLAIDISEIRNSIRIIYADAADLWPDKTPKRKVYETNDPTSIAKYGELWMEIQEDETSNIDSATEAITLAAAALSDCKDPTAQMTVPLTRGFPWVEVNDYYKFTAAGATSIAQPFFDSDQSLAVTGWDQSYEAGGDGTHVRIKTTLQVRGLPTTGAMTHFRKELHPEKPLKQKSAGSAHKRVPFQGPATASLNFFDAVGGTRVSVVTDVDKNALVGEYELHVYQTPGTPLDSTTLLSVGTSRNMMIGDLHGGETYYARTVPRGYNHGRLVRGEPSAEVSFVAGRASAGHLKDGMAIGDYPLNGGFETQVGAFADHWTIESGASQWTMRTDPSGMSGTKYVRLVATGSSASMHSATFPIIKNQRYRLAFSRFNANANTGGAWSVLIRILDETGAELNVLTLASGISATDHKNAWKREEYFFTPGLADAGARQVQIRVQWASGTFTCDFDELRVAHVGTPWYEVGAGGVVDNDENVPGFDNTYSAFNTTTDSHPALRKDNKGRVYLKGDYKHATTTTVGSSLVTLPAGWRPPRKLSFIIAANGQDALLEVNTTGTCVLVQARNANPSTKVSFDGISFETYE